MNDCEKLRARGGWHEDAALGRCTPPIGPRNTWSNIAYPVVGIALLSVDGSAWAMATALTTLGIGSGIYHAFKTKWANKLDWIGMYAVMGSLVVHGSVTNHPAAPWVMLMVSTVLGVVFANRMGANDLIGLMLGFAAVPAVLLGNWEYVLVSMVCFVQAYVVWHWDAEHKAWLGLWGHAVWHIMTAVAIGMMYLAQVH